MAARAVAGSGGEGRVRCEALGGRAAWYLSRLIVPLAAVAAGGGLLIPGLYRDSAALVPVLRGQDLVTLLALPAMAVAMAAARRGSGPGLIVWAGVLGYLLYTYLGAAMAYAFNGFILIYIALLALVAFALTSLCAAIDPADLAGRFDAAAPRRAVAGFLGTIAVFLAAAELAQIVPALLAGEVPGAMARYGLSSFFVYALDLGLVVPLSLLAAVWLWRGQPWGHLLAGCMLIKAAVMGAALLAMNWFALRAGQPTDGLVALWAAIGLGGAGVAAWFLSHCRG